jgi:hypothetical protein
VFAAPTAWLPPEGAATGVGALDLRAVADGRVESTLMIGYGLGGLAQLELGTDADVRGCDRCGDDRPRPLALGRAAFRIGARQDAWFHGMPALVVGVRTTYAAAGGFDDVRVVDGYVVASRELGPLRVHAGLAVHDAAFAGAAALGPTARPIAGLEWTPGQYPKTSLMADFTYLPLLVRDDASARVELEWLAGWGVRYQAFDWGAIELAVRHRQDEGLGDSTVFVRVHGVWRDAFRR